MSGGDTVTSTWRAFGPIRTEWERSVVSTRSSILAGLVKTDLTTAIRCRSEADGHGIPDRFPELAAADDRVLSLVYEEFCLCEERDGCADVDSFCDRYPDWKSSLESQLRYHRLISQAAGASEALPRFPKAGRAIRRV